MILYNYDLIHCMIKVYKFYSEKKKYKVSYVMTL